MIAVTQPGCVLLLIGIVTMAAHSQKNASEYVAPAQAIPHGAAPGMKVQLLSRGGETKEYTVIFSKGGEAFSGLLAFAEKFHVTSAHFTAIGGLNGGTEAWFDTQCKMFKKIPIESQVEVASMIGDVALYRGMPVVHAHMVVANSNGTVRGSHVLEAHVDPTLEVMVKVDPAAMQKRYDLQTDISLIDPALK
jgi:predicted DNA-binding protein with PD1-like motif